MFYHIKLTIFFIFLLPGAIVKCAADSDASKIIPLRAMACGYSGQEGSKRSIENFKGVVSYFKLQKFPSAQQATGLMALPPEMVECIAAHCDLSTLAVLRALCRHGRAGARKALPEKIMDYWGASLLHNLILWGHKDLVSGVLIFGVKPNAVYFKQPALYKACYQADERLHCSDPASYVSIVEILLKAKADPNCVTLDTGQTPLMVAPVSACNLLLHYKAKIDSIDKNGGTALEYAWHDNPKKAQLLVSKGARWQW